jgi:hypothetical protein
MIAKSDGYASCLPNLGTQSDDQRLTLVTAQILYRPAPDLDHELPVGVNPLHYQSVANFVLIATNAAKPLWDRLRPGCTGPRGTWENFVEIARRFLRIGGPSARG